MRERLASVVVAICIPAISAPFALAGMFWGFGLKCDDSCSADGTRWRDDVDAWQWDALGWTGLALFCCAVAFTVAVVFRGRSIAAVALAAWAVVAVGYVRFEDASGLTSHAERGYMGLVVAVAVGIAAISLTPPRRPHLVGG